MVYMGVSLGVLLEHEERKEFDMITRKSLLEIRKRIKEEMEKADKGIPKSKAEEKELQYGAIQFDRGAHHALSLVDSLLEKLMKEGWE